MTASNIDMSSEAGSALPPIVPGKLILNGENPFIRLSHAPGEPPTSDASLWTITYSPRGAGHALFVKSELTDDRWRIYSDNPQMVRWLQTTVQGMLNPETAGHRHGCHQCRVLTAGKPAGQLDPEGFTRVLMKSPLPGAI